MKAAIGAILRDRWFWITLGVGAATAFYRLDGHGLWGDEVWQALWSGQQNVMDTLWRFRAPPDFPLHFVWVHLSTLWSQDAAWVRLPSAILGTLTVPLTYLLGRRVFGPTAGALAAILLAIAPFHVWFTQDARPYAALAFYSLLALFFFDSLRRAPTWLACVGLTFATTLNLYNHFFALMPILSMSIVVAVQTGADLYRARPDLPVRLRRAVRLPLAFGASVGTAFLLASPLIPGYIQFILARGPGEVEAPPFQLTLPFLTDLFGMYGGGTGWSLPLFVGLCLVGLAAAALARNTFALTGVAWLTVPLLVLWIAQPRHIFIPRYFMFAQPVYLLFISYGAFALGDWVVARAGAWKETTPRAHAIFRPATLTAFLFLALVALLPPTWQSYRVERINDWGTMCEYLHRNAHPGDAISGDGYIVGLMSWCYPHPTDVPIIDGNGVPLESLTNRGLNIWFLQINPRTEAWLAERFERVPRTGWGNPDLVVTHASGDFKYLQAEHLANLWYFEARAIPSRLVLNDLAALTTNGQGYAEIAGYTRYATRLRLPTDAPRILAVTVQERDGGNLVVFVDGKVVGRYRPKSDSRSWRRIQFDLPVTVGENFLVELFNPPGTGAAVRELEVLAGN